MLLHPLRLLFFLCQGGLVPRGLCNHAADLLDVCQAALVGQVPDQVVGEVDLDELSGCRSREEVAALGLASNLCEPLAWHRQGSTQVREERVAQAIERDDFAS